MGKRDRFEIISKSFSWGMSQLCDLPTLIIIGAKGVLQAGEEE